MNEYIVTQDWIKGDEVGKPIVRCRDCKYAMAYTKAAYCEYMNHVVEINGFCAWGERRTDDN